MGTTVAPARFSKTNIPALNQRSSRTCVNCRNNHENVPNALVELGNQNPLPRLSASSVDVLSGHAIGACPPVAGQLRCAGLPLSNTPW